jgi:hypothetical protein
MDIYMTEEEKRLHKLIAFLTEELKEQKFINQFYVREYNRLKKIEEERAKEADK